MWVMMGSIKEVMRHHVGAGQVKGDRPEVLGHVVEVEEEVEGKPKQFDVVRSRLVLRFSLVKQQRHTGGIIGLYKVTRPGQTR